MLDQLAAGMVLVALAPLLLLIAILVKLDSRGPVFVTQRHVGRNGRRFSLAKFRTTHTRGGRHLVALSAHESADIGMLDDPRLTRIGRLLRRSCLDELPKLWSVLRGDMSLCGPAPLIAGENETAWQPRPRMRAGAPPWQNGHIASPARAGRVWRNIRRLE